MEKELIDFSNNVNFLGPPPGVREFLASEYAKNFMYPDEDQRAAKKAISEVYKIPEDTVAISVGSTELISATTHFSKLNALIVSPSFWEYEFFFAKSHGNNRITWLHLNEANNFSYDYGAIEDIMKCFNIDICYLANPNNPTTSKLVKKEMLDVIKSYPGVVFVVDETYLPFSFNCSSDSLIHEAASVLSNLIVVRSMSKVYSVPGVRIGFGISNSEKVRKIYEHLIPYGVCSMALTLVPWLLSQSNYVQLTQESYQKGRDYFKYRIRTVFGDSVLIVDNGSPFVLLKIPCEKCILAHLRQRGITVRGGQEFKGLDYSWMRVAIRNFDDMDKLITSLKEILLKPS